MEKLLDKSMAQTDEVIGIAQRFSDEIGRLEAERDRLREVNKELVYVAQSFRILLSHANKDVHPELQKRFHEALSKAEKTA